jgi:hypothetical protein
MAKLLVEVCLFTFWLWVSLSGWRNPAVTKASLIAWVTLAAWILAGKVPARRWRPPYGLIATMLAASVVAIVAIWALWPAAERVENIAQSAQTLENVPPPSEPTKQAEPPKREQEPAKPAAPPPVDTPERPDKRRPPEEPVAPTTLAGGPLFISCNMGLMPKVVPPEGRIFALGLWPTPVENGGSGLAEYFANPGSEWKWATGEAGIATAYRCQLTNYGSTPLLKVETALHLRFRESMPKGPSSSESGKVVLDRPWLIQVAHIEQGASNAFVFYVFNNSAHFVDVFPPSSAEGHAPGDERKQTIKVDTPTGPLGPAYLILAPLMEKKRQGDNEYEGLHQSVA